MSRPTEAASLSARVLFPSRSRQAVGAAGERAGLRGVPRLRGTVAASAHLPGVWPCRLLRRFAKPPRHRACQRNTAPVDPFAGAWRDMGVVLHRPRRDARPPCQRIHADTTLAARHSRADQGARPARWISVTVKFARSGAPQYRAIE